jgi:RNA polymerase sigma-70 factor (family 1)
MLNKSLSDPELILAIINNDEKAFNELFERHWARVYVVACKYVKDEELSLEITHDIFLNIWNKRHQLHINSFKNYVLTAASYHGIRKRQMQKATPIQYVDDLGYTENNMHALNHAITVNAGETSIQTQELDTEVDALLNELPKRCREIYLLSRKDNLSITEIAEMLHISKRTVENQLTNALKHLRTSLQYMVILYFLLNR